MAAFIVFGIFQGFSAESDLGTAPYSFLYTPEHSLDGIEKLGDIISGITCLPVDSGFQVRIHFIPMADHVDLSLQIFFERFLYVNQVKQIRFLHLDNYVNVAVFTRFVPRYGAKNSDPGNSIESFKLSR